MSVILAFLSTSLGKYVISAVTVASALLAGWLRAKALGRKEQRAAQDAADAAARTEGQKIDDAVAGRTADDNRGRLGKWSKS
jgi:hypothetical protein